MKNYRETIIEKVQNFLDQNVGDYSYFKASTWYQKFTKKYDWYEEEELGWIWDYLMKVEEESHIESELW